jgi:hypothetical protein
MDESFLLLQVRQSLTRSMQSTLRNMSQHYVATSVKTKSVLEVSVGPVWLKPRRMASFPPVASQPRMDSLFRQMLRRQLRLAMSILIWSSQIIICDALPVERTVAVNSRMQQLNRRLMNLGMASLRIVMSMSRLMIHHHSSRLIGINVSSVIDVLKRVMTFKLQVCFKWKGLDRTLGLDSRMTLQQWKTQHVSPVDIVQQSVQPGHL